MKLKNYLNNLIFPPKCIACNCNIPLGSSAMFCYECSKAYFPNTKTTCKVCGKPIAENRDDTCNICKNNKIYYIKNVSRYLYNGCVKDGILNMKFKNRQWIAFEFGKVLLKTIEAEYSNIKFDYILYVPMTPLSELKRGFNQSFEMAQIISKKLGIPVATKVLYKKAGVKTQSGLKYKERVQNVKNAFIVRNSHLLTDKIILLVDDVFTTGSTVNECARVLKRNGAMAVYSATVATVSEDK